jgi:hypothetical protein
MKLRLITFIIIILQGYSCTQPVSKQDNPSTDSVSSEKVKADSIQLKPVIIKTITDSIRDGVPLTDEQMVFHFNIDTMYVNGGYQFSGFLIEKFRDSSFIARIDCFDGDACIDQLLIVFNRFTLKESDHMLVDIGCESDKVFNGRSLDYTRLSDSTFSTEEKLHGKGATGTERKLDVVHKKIWQISVKGKIELKNSQRWEQ